MDTARKYNIRDLASEFHIGEDDVRRALVKYIGSNMYYNADHEEIMINAKYKCDESESYEQIIFERINRNELDVRLGICWDLEFSFTEDTCTKGVYNCDIHLIPTVDQLRKDMVDFFGEICLSYSAARKYTRVFANADPREVECIVCGSLEDISDRCWAIIKLLKYEDRTDVEVIVHTDDYDIEEKPYTTASAD